MLRSTILLTACLVAPEPELQTRVTICGFDPSCMNRAFLADHGILDRTTRHRTSVHEK
jgi:hypothetical protein